MGNNSIRTSAAELTALLLAGAPASAQSVGENDRGTVRIAGNELLIDSKVDDPGALRGGAPPTQTSLFKLSGDVLVGGRREEVVLQQFKQTRDGRRGGEFYLGLKAPGTGTTDEAMIDALTATVRDGFRFHLPISAPNLQQGEGAMIFGSWFMQSPNGHYRAYMQDDGNLVVYRVNESGNWLCPVWSLMTGPLPPCEDAADQRSMRWREVSDEFPANGD
jgi:hypothetical protein